MPLAALALSGGVDSLVAALRLRGSGRRLIGLHFATGFETDSPDAVRALARRLDIPLHEIDLSSEFRREIVDGFAAAYRAGRTPNPCLACNPRIKFGRLLDHARRLGAERLATGHYARTDRGADGRVRLLRGADREKDQSYFLARIPADRLAAAEFPLGDLTKSRVRELAAEAGFAGATRPESQDICFVRDHYADFLAAEGVPSRPGDIVATDGKIVGRHEGLHRYTVGQRRGIGVPGPEPFYAIRLEPGENRLVIGTRDELAARGCRVERINWIAPPPEGPAEARVRVRYRHRAAPARIVPGPGGTADVQFDMPQSAVAPGQGAVFFRDDEILGGGIIAEAL